MIRAALSLLLSILLIGTAHAQQCATSFPSVLQQHLAAIKDRDLESYMMTVAPEESQLMILPDGSSWNSRAEIRAGHAAWFADQSWQFNTSLVRQELTEHWGLVVYRVTVDRPAKPGSPFLLSMLFAPEKNGCWYLQHDQNTLLPAD